jgi:hypothetical protein
MDIRAEGRRLRMAVRAGESSGGWMLGQGEGSGGAVRAGGKVYRMAVRAGEGSGERLLGQGERGVGWLLGQWEDGGGLLWQGKYAKWRLTGC